MAILYVKSEENFHFDPWAEYTVLTAAGNRLNLAFQRIPFDVAELVCLYRASGRPYAEEAAAQHQPAA